MTVGQDGGFTPGREIDEVRWLDPAAAAATLSYVDEIEVLAAHREMPPVTAMVAIVRHATAGGRDSWPGQDSARPLDPAGTVHAADLASVLRWYVPRRLVSAPPRRCVQTLAPLAALVDAAIEVESAFGEAADPVSAAGRIRGLARTAPSIVVCSQGGLIPPLLAALVPGPHPTPKGTGWVLAFAGDDIVAVEPLGV
jgi:8-oxo-dGTP diphosphatase